MIIKNAISAVSENAKINKNLKSEPLNVSQLKAPKILSCKI